MKKACKKIVNRLNKKLNHKRSEVKNILTKTETRKIIHSDFSLQIRLIINKCITCLRRNDQCEKKKSN